MIKAYELLNTISREDIINNRIQLPAEILNKQGLFMIHDLFRPLYIGYSNNLLLTTYQLYYRSLIGQQEDILTRGISAYISFGEPMFLAYDEKNEYTQLDVEQYVELEKPIFNSNLTNHFVRDISEKITQSEKSQLMKNGMTFKYITGDDEYVYYINNELKIYGIIRNREAQ